MPKARIFGKGANGEDVLLSTVDLDTGDVTYYVSPDVVAKQRNKNMERVSVAASDIAAQNPTSPLFNLEKGG